MIPSLSLVSLLLLPQANAFIPRKWPRGTPTSGDCSDLTNIMPEEDIVFHDCCNLSVHALAPLQAPKYLECARLSLPLDWWNVSDSRKVSIALIRASSGLKVSDPAYGGPLIVNPGGPGQSGVQYLQGDFNNLQVDINGGGKIFDIVSFDPRGVLSSTPSVKCPPHNLITDLFMDCYGYPTSDVSREDRQSLWEAQRKWLNQCTDSANQTIDSQGIWSFMGTMSVARDMLAIVDKLDQLSQQSQPRFANTSNGKDPKEPPAIEKPKAKLQYLGYSYGTALGNLFASMFPDRVKRMILDGNIDANEYFGSGFKSILNDADAAFEYFLRSCSEASESCPLASNDKVDLERIEALTEGTDSREVRAKMYTGIKSPLVSFKALASTLDNYLKGRPINQENSTLDDQESCPLNFTDQEPFYDLLLARDSVWCSDSERRADHDFEAFENYYDQLKSESPMFASVSQWAYAEAACRVWPSAWRSKYHYEGRLGTDNTTMPILFLTNKFDPITPRRNAYRMSKQYPDSAVLELHAAGHCALAQPTRCLRNHIYNYLADGTLPKSGTVCNDASNPFEVAELQSAKGSI